MTKDFFFSSSQQIKTNVNLTMTENGFGQDDAAYHMLIDTVLKDNFDKVCKQETHSSIHFILSVVSRRCDEETRADGSRPESIQLSW